jgi:pilus assembly protein Flp/PilA
VPAWKQARGEATRPQGRGCSQDWGIPRKSFVNLNSKGSQMNTFLKAVSQSVKSFARDDDGAQVVEYALIIAVVSIALVIALKALGGGSFTAFITRVNACLTTAACV